MSKGAVMGLVFAVLVGLLVFAAMRGLSSVTCEVCVTFNDETLCRTGTGKNRQAAIDSAQRACCALLSSGMTESIKCGNTEPDSVDCE